jgi:hypothetical protein
MKRTRFEGAEPILSVAELERSLRYYIDVLGFINAEWGGTDFTRVSRDNAGIYLSEGDQGIQAPGCGWASKMSEASAKSTRKVEQRFYTHPSTTRGRTR